MLLADLGGLGEAERDQVPDVPLEVAAVRRQRVVGQPTLDLQVLEVALDGAAQPPVVAG